MLLVSYSQVDASNLRFDATQTLSAQYGIPRLCAGAQGYDSAWIVSYASPINQIPSHRSLSGEVLRLQNDKQPYVHSDFNEKKSLFQLLLLHKSYLTHPSVLPIPQHSRKYLSTRNVTLR